MKKLSLAILLVMTQALALSAYAQDNTKPKTRAEVKAERDAAAKAAGLNKGEANKGEVSASPAAKSSKTRAEIKAERDAAAKAAKASKGESNKGEVSAAPVAKSEKARAEVKAEGKAAARSGELAKTKGPGQQ